MAIIRESIGQFTTLVILSGRSGISGSISPLVMGSLSQLSPSVRIHSIIDARSYKRQITSESPSTGIVIGSPMSSCVILSLSTSTPFESNVRVDSGNDLSQNRIVSKK